MQKGDFCSKVSHAQTKNKAGVSLLNPSLIFWFVYGECRETRNGAAVPSVQGERRKARNSAAVPSVQGELHKSGRSATNKKKPCSSLNMASVILEDPSYSKYCSVSGI